MVDLPQCAAVDQITRQANGRHKAVVEGHHVLDAGLGDRVEHLPGLLAGARQRLLAEDMLACLRSSDTRFSMHIVGTTVIKELDVVIFQHLAPVGVVTFIPIATRCLGYCLFITSTDGDQLGDSRRGIHHVGQLLIAIAVRLAHEIVAQHTDADFRGFAFGSGPCHLGESGLFAHDVLLLVLGLECGIERYV